jgi:galactokinase/mevalonate kinase-like predicted kinase
MNPLASLTNCSRNIFIFSFLLFSERICILRFSLAMKTLLSIPENLVSCFHEITGCKSNDFFVLADPHGTKIGSGGGTAHLLTGHRTFQQGSKSFEEYLNDDKKIIIHAGGQSRRIPAYAPSGKILAPLPVFRWSRGQRLDQTLLDLQLPLLRKIMEISGASQNVMIAAGDVLIQSSEVPFELPSADVVCFGIWTDPHMASRHGVFFVPRDNPGGLDFMLQKPGHRVIEQLTASHLFLMDVGIWVLSNRAVKLLMKKCGYAEEDDFKSIKTSNYDLYSAFGTCLGEHPSETDAEICRLTSAIVPINAGEFYHYGTSRELITSTERIQNKVQDQRNIWHNRIKPDPSLFVQNTIAEIRFDQGHHHIWIENSHVSEGWKLQCNHIITGVPENDWNITMPGGCCLDIIPVGEEEYCIRPYGIEDAFRGVLSDPATLWIGKPFVEWMSERGIAPGEGGLMTGLDLQEAPLFPVVKREELNADLIQWMLECHSDNDQRSHWLTLRRLTADEISEHANLKRLFGQRETYRRLNLKKLKDNYKHSVFYQVDLKHTAVEFAVTDTKLSNALADYESPMMRFRDHMFRSEVLRLRGLDGAAEEESAFRVLRETVVSTLREKSLPRLNVFSDQIVWGRSPVRMDLAGGWSDTPPYCLQNGGSVLNIAVELNGQPPIQCYIRLCAEKRIMLRSIDNGVSEVVTSFDDIRTFNQVGSAFSIPKAALYLTGFHPDCCSRRYSSLQDQLREFGGGFEISVLAAVPKGSGMGTSSILAATILGSLSDFCCLNWDQQVVCHRTFVLEQLLTTGGGWQDQYGGILPGIKLLESNPGNQDSIGVKWMPDRLFTQPAYKDLWLLYYTGVTRVAKNILAEIVRGLFLNESHRLQTLDEIKRHAHNMAEAIQHSDYKLTAQMVARSWKLNNALDSGTNTPEIQKIIDQVRDYSYGFKLPGAGGGGYMLIAAKDEDAAASIRHALSKNPPNAKARFVKMEISQTGFQVSRS